VKNLYNLYKFANNLGKLHIPILPQVITYLMRIIFGCYIPHTCKIGEGTKFGYGGLCVVIHGRSEIGKNCLISQGVTL